MIETTNTGLDPFEGHGAPMESKQESKYKHTLLSDGQNTYMYLR
jgi:hypothetical protein